MPTSGRGPDPTAAVAAAATVAAKKTSLESGDDSEEESEILEESPCGRWLKRREVVSSRGFYPVGPKRVVVLCFYSVIISSPYFGVI